MAMGQQQRGVWRCSLAAACLLLATTLQGAHCQIVRERQAARTFTIAGTGTYKGTIGVGAFITISGGSFVDENCKEFFFSGYNTWELLETAAGYSGNTGDLAAQFAAAAANNLTVVRMFGFGVASGFPLQYSPGSYNERAFQAFDKVLDEAAKHKLRLVIALVNNWDQDSNADNKKFYANGANVDTFFTATSARTAYKNHIKTVVNRKNSINGLVYSADPTILSWNLINEPRCKAIGCNKDIQAWVEEMAPYLKALDPNHLVTVGMDGFYDRRSCQAASGNPSSWAGYTGQDFLPQHAVKGIDYAAIHLWPDNWKRVDQDFGRIWLSNHSANGQMLNKPVVLEEFGKGVDGSNKEGQTEQERLAWYTLVYSLVEQQINAGSPLKGIMFWRWDAVAATISVGVGDNALTLASSSSEFQTVIKPFSGRVAAAGKAVATCTPAATGTVSAASIGSTTSPSPDTFIAPDSDTCCSKDCGTMYGSLEGTVVKSGLSASAGDCCDSCKGTTGCNTWNFCYCELGCAGGIAKGTCVLKNQGNAFYPRALTTGSGAGWIGGVPGQTSITPTWLCQPGATATCPITQVATCPVAALQTSLECPAAGCNAKDQNVAGNTLVFDVNSNSPTKTVYSAADCCKACQGLSNCNTWTFCGRTEGCSNDCPANVLISKQAGSPTFGPYGQCQGNRFPYQQCTLKNSANNLLEVYEQGELQPWTSGTLFTPTNVKYD